MAERNGGKIDFVLLWVDGSDLRWLEEKNRYSDSGGIVSASQSAARYRDWDNLQYWFRGVEKFAPWVNKIYFITWGHTPSWLNKAHPKLKIVNHRDFIPEEYLPTFNSNAIELNLHRIDGLSEHFVAFNDDMFIIDHVEARDFFIERIIDAFVRRKAICQTIEQHQGPLFPVFVFAVAHTCLGQIAVKGIRQFFIL